MMIREHGFLIHFQKIYKIIEELDGIMNETRTYIYFFPWFERNYAKINIREDNTTSRIKNSQTNKEYPPSESTTLTHLESQIIVSPLKITSLNDDNKNREMIPTLISHNSPTTS
jgi:hypothetical protein